jgi:hypothetical protein
MPWVPPDWARAPQELSDRWLGACRKLSRHEQFFASLGWGDRLGHLFAVACVRAAFTKKLNNRSQALLDLLERVADEPAAQDQLIAEVNTIYEEGAEWQPLPVHEAAYAVASMKPNFAAGSCATLKRHREAFGKILAAMVHPGWPWSDAWRAEAVVGVARGIYNERAWQRRPILSDALVDAGCDDSRIRGYCRGEGPFLRGCWILDQALGKRD